MNTPATLLFCACLCTLSLPSTAQEGDMTDRPRPASAPSLGKLFGGIRDRIGSLRGAEPPPATAAADATSPEATLAASAPGAGGPRADAVKLKDFKTGANGKLGQTWNDGHCPELVEPFDLTDSLMSLGKLRGRQVADDAMKKLMGQSTVDPRATHAEIREAARQLNWLPMALEVQIGQQIHDNQSNLLREDRASAKPTYARARRLLAEVVAGIQEPNPYDFKIFVTNASDGNAEAAPGGWIYVDKDLVEKASEEPRARFAIAHEVSHVLQRHRTRETQMRLSDGADSIQALGKLVEAANRNGGNSLLKGALDTKRMFVRHSEEQELQADGCAARLLDNMTANRTDMIRSIDAFVAALPKPTPPEPTRQVTAEAVFGELTDGQFSRHPNSTERVKNLNGVVADLRKGR